MAVEYGDLRRDLHVAELDQGVFGIAEGWQVISIIFDGLANVLRAFTLVRIDEPELRLTGVALADFLDGRSIAPGHWTVPSQKYQHYDLAGIGSQGVDHSSIQIESGLLGAPRAECRKHDRRQDCCKPQLLGGNH